jgi:CHAT domain-containing protein/tetratricopeptide (TPR) repeat protein
VDSFYSYQNYPELEEALERQIDYLLTTSRYDSIHDFIYKLGHTKTQLGKLDEGLERANYLVDLIEKETSDSSDIIFGINELSWVYYEAGLDSMAFLTDKRTLEFCKAYSKVRTNELSDAYYNLGFDYQFFGNTPEAIVQFKEALKILDTDTSKALLSRRVDCYNALGASYWKYGDMTKAKEALKKSSELSLQLSDTVKGKFYASNAIGNLSLAYEDEGNLAKSMDLLQEAIELRKKGLEGNLEAYDRKEQLRHLYYNYHNLSSLYLSIGDVDRAWSMNEYAFLLQTEHFPNDEKKQIEYDDAKGTLKIVLEEYASAEMFLLRNLQRTIDTYGATNFYTLKRHQSLGELYFEWGKHEKALYHIEQTIKIGKEVSDEFGSRDMARAYRFRSSIQSILEQYEEAHSGLKRSSEIFADGMGNEAIPVGENALMRAEIYLKEGKKESAEFFLNQALELFELNRRVQQNQESAAYSGIVRMLPDALRLKARMIEGKDEQSLESSLNYLEEALIYLREERRNFSSDGSQLSFIDGHAEIYSEASAISYKLFELTGDKKYQEQVLRYSEERKTVLLKRQLNKFTSLRVAQVPDSIIVQERRLLKELSEPNVMDEYAEKEQAYDRLISHIQEEYPSYYDLRYSSKTASSKEIQEKLLRDGQNLLEYVQTSDGLLVFIINKSTVHLKELTSENLRKKVEDFNAALLSRNQNASESIGDELRRMLFEPIEEYIDGEEVLIVPDGPLYALNFESLYHSKKQKFLVEEYTLSYLLSATTSVLYQDLSRRARRSEIIAFAPGFENDENLSSSGEKFIRQPFAVKTAEFINGLFAGQSLTAAQATEEQFKTKAKDYNIIHLGTHTEVNSSSPMLSRLILSKSDNEDGYLHAYEIYNLSLRAELAVLTACETGVGKESSSEGVLSIAHGFAYAGCPSLVMSLWEIDEKTSAEIIESFYKYLAEGEEKNDALRKAKLDYLETASPELRHPYYWSGIVLFGNTSVVHKPTNWYLIGSVALVFLLILVFYFSAKKKRA